MPFGPVNLLKVWLLLSQILLLRVIFSQGLSISRDESLWAVCDHFRIFLLYLIRIFCVADTVSFLSLVDGSAPRRAGKSLTWSS